MHLLSLTEQATHINFLIKLGLKNNYVNFGFFAVFFFFPEYMYVNLAEKAYQYYGKDQNQLSGSNFSFPCSKTETAFT